MTLMWCGSEGCKHRHFHVLGTPAMKFLCSNLQCTIDHYYETDKTIQERPTFQPPPHGQVATEDTRRSASSQEPEEETGFDLARSTMGRVTVEGEGFTIRNMREFTTGATRDSDEDKLDFEGFLSPLVLERYAQYMHEHRKQRDGKLRDSDNWQKGMPKNAYAKSLIRHVFEFWRLRRERKRFVFSDELQNVLCAIMFNAMGYLYEELRDG